MVYISQVLLPTWTGCDSQRYQGRQHLDSAIRLVNFDVMTAMGAACDNAVMWSPYWSACCLPYPAWSTSSLTDDVYSGTRGYRMLWSHQWGQWVAGELCWLKMKTLVHRGLIHPNDIKTIVPSLPTIKSAPLPDVNWLGHAHVQSHLLNLVTPLSVMPFMASSWACSYSCSPSFADSSNGSIRKSDAWRVASHKFNKYAEDDDDLGGGAVEQCHLMWLLLVFWFVCL